MPTSSEDYVSVTDPTAPGGTRLVRRDHLNQTAPTTEPSANGDRPDIPEVDPWPNPPNEAAFYGLAGQIVNTIAPHTESDPCAILVDLLVSFGNAIGRSPYYRVEATRHHTNLSAVLVGPTSKGRKGTSRGHVQSLMEMVDETWARSRIAGGLTSGEGLIWSVRDPISTREPIKKNGVVTDYQWVETDPGVADKRLMVVETEYAAPLRIMARDGNTLSAVMRQAWDVGSLAILNKNSPAQASNAHISTLGHITRDELLMNLAETDKANGYANRVLWVAVRRSKCLPEGGYLAPEDVAPLVKWLREAVEFARPVGEMHRDDDARAMWAHVYPSLSEGHPGMFGAVTSRAEAQTLRLSMLYALLDCSDTIRPEHLLAAVALWDYCEASALWLFGSKTGDATADAILAGLRAAPDGLTRTEISDLLGRNKPSAEIVRALTWLAKRGIAIPEKVGGEVGRPAEVWRLGSFVNSYLSSCTLDHVSLLNSFCLYTENNSIHTEERKEE